MKITKANSMFKKIFFTLILISLILITSVSNIITPSMQTNVSSYGADSDRKVPLYEVETFYNIVILTELADATFKNSDYPIIESAFNDNNPNAEPYSLREYFKDQSGGKLEIISVFMFYSSSTTTAAFKKLDTNGQTPFVNSALSGEVYKDINRNEVLNCNNGVLDANNDDLIDSVTIYLPLTITDNDSKTDSAAWPHTVIGNSYFNRTFKNLRYNRYVINSYRYQYSINGLTTVTMNAPIGVMCHEMLHNIGNDAGIQDLYHYPQKIPDSYYESLMPVGNFCIMASTDYENPQPLNIYYKSKLGWADLTEKESGEVSLSKTKAEGVKFGVNGSEFFVAQFWQANSYNGESPQTGSGAEGVIIYRVNTSVKTGNMGDRDGENPTGKKDEIYVFRQNKNLQSARNFPALKTGSYKNLLTYSDEVSAKLNIKIDVGADAVTINIERYRLEFRVNGELVPYEISVKLNSGASEKTISGAYVFTYEDIAFGRIDFECFGYEFYKDSGLNNKITFIMLKNYEHELNDENFIITIYLVAIPRDIFTVNFKDFEGNTLGFNLQSIDYMFNGEEGIFSVENFSIEFSKFKNFQVKNGDKIYFTLEINGDRYRTEILEITPDIVTTANINLAKLCKIEGIVVSKGTPLPNVKILINGEGVLINGKPLVTDSDGKFALEDIPQGSMISFELKNYQIKDFRVIQDDLNLSINAGNLSDSSRIVIIIASVIIGIIIIATIISVSINRKKHSYLTNERYDE